MNAAVAAVTLKDVVQTYLSCWQGQTLADFVQGTKGLRLVQSQLLGDADQPRGLLLACQIIAMVQSLPSTSVSPDCVTGKFKSKNHASVLLLRNLIKHTSVEGQGCNAWLKLHCISASIRSTVWGAVSNSFPASCVAQFLLSCLAVECCFDL